ncbi:hypothetical protein [Streptomyces sp. URMC 123]|uniref:hypothetical protein n=1 Tax=Streptomyces sp. URMC 123 TaxID=3423403 RepID=UPI003F1AECA2
MNDDDVAVRDTARMKETVGRASGTLLDIMGLAGKTTEPGPAASPCDGRPSGEGVRVIRHPWSLYDVPVDDMYAAMDRLREQLPRKGWKIVKDGPDKSPARTPQIVADSTEEPLSADIRLLDERPYGKHTSLLEVTVVSTCFKEAKPSGS